MTVAALVLAAGVARRFGGDKRRLPVSPTQTLLEFTVAKYAGVFDHCCVVMRANDDIPPPWRTCSRITVLLQQNLQAGMGDNLALGARHLQQMDVDALVVALADMPRVARSTLQQLKAQASSSTIVVPCVGARRGHPVLFGRNHFAALAALGGDEGARAVLAVNASSIVMLQTHDSGVIDDVDTPEDWQRIQALLQADA